MDYPPKKPKVVTGPIDGETSNTSKLPSKPGPSRGKGLMKGADPVVEKCPVLLREDLGYALKQLLSIIKGGDYEDLGNHANEAMGKTSLFSMVQVFLSIPFPLFRPTVVSF